MGTTWAIVGTVAPIIIGLGAALMTMSGTAAHVTACVAFLLSGSTVLITAAIWWRRHPTRDWTVHVRAIGLAILVLIATPTMLWFAWPADAQTGAASPTVQQNNQGAPNINAPGNGNQFNFGSARPPASPTINTPNNSGIITYGQSGGENIVNNGPKYASITEDTVKGIRQRIPSGSHIVVDRAIQDGPSEEMANKIQALLQQLGYDVDPMIGDAMGVPYFRGIQIQKEGGTEKDYTVLVGDPRLN